MIDEVDVGGVRISVMRPVKEMMLDTYVEVERILPEAMKEYARRIDDSSYDYIYLRSCDKGSCNEILTPVGDKPLKHKYMISPRLSRLLALSVICWTGNGKEADRFSEPQMGLESFEVCEEAYVFEGELEVKGRDGCVGVLLTTDSGSRILMLDEVYSTIAGTRGRRTVRSRVLKKRKRRRRKKSRKRLKKKG